MNSSAHYYEVFAALRGVYLEDSFVLKIEQSPGVVEFELDARLMPDHPRYHRPYPGEYGCYERARLRLRSAGRLRLTLSGAPPAVDAGGETDLGNIDSMQSVAWDGGVAWELQGEWGELRVSEPEVTLTPSA